MLAMLFHLSSAQSTMLSLSTTVAIIINKCSILVLIDENVNKRLTSEMRRPRSFLNGFEKLRILHC